MSGSSRKILVLLTAFDTLLLNEIYMNNPVNIEQNKEDIRRHVDDDDEIALRELFSVIW